MKASQLLQNTEYIKNLTKINQDLEIIKDRDLYIISVRCGTQGLNYKPDFDLYKQFLITQKTLLEQHLKAMGINVNE